jgi:hypothetical protein
MRERWSNGFPKSNALKSWSPVANRKSDPDYLVFIMDFFFQFYMPRKMLSRTPC